MIANRDIRDILHPDSQGHFRAERCYAAIPEQPWKNHSGNYKQCSNHKRTGDYCRIHQSIVRKEVPPRRSWWRRLLRL